MKLGLCYFVHFLGPSPFLRLSLRLRIGQGLSMSFGSLLCLGLRLSQFDELLSLCLSQSLGLRPGLVLVLHLKLGSSSCLSLCCLLSLG